MPTTPKQEGDSELAATLLREVYQALHKVPLAQIRNSRVNVSAHAEVAAASLLVQLRHTVWSRALGDHIVRYPADWWQAFKQRFFPYWARKRWPVLETTVVITAYHDYPGVVIQDQEPLLHYRQSYPNADS